MGGAAAGVRFYCAYPMSPSSGVLHWMAAHGRQLGIMVRQVEDELGVINMAVGAAHTGARAMCATSGGGFALMTEALGAAAMMEVPVVCINVQRAGPATGVPTKTEQGDLWQALGAGQGDYPRIIVAPTTIEDCFHIVPEVFNLADRFQCPAIILSDLLLSEGRFSIDPAELDFNVPIERGDVIGLNGANGHSASGDYRRYEITPSGISPRAIPGTEGYVHVVATDEHDEDGVLISDEFTNPIKRQAMHEKRMRKMDGVLGLLEAPALFGPADAEVTLIGWGSTQGVIREAMQQLAAEGIVANNLQVKWLVPLHAEAIAEIVERARTTIIVENNYSGQFARYLRSETSIVADGHIRKYDGEPFMPHHIVDGVKAVLARTARAYVPVHEIMV
jgi:2-oxoglutarate ferredoxin oxidoreductase subunit alpha